MTTATQVAQTGIAPEFETMIAAITSVPLPDEGHMWESWTLEDVSSWGIAERVLDLVEPLFEIQEKDAKDFTFLLDQSIMIPEFAEGLAAFALPRVLTAMADTESQIAAEKHTAGYTELGRPLGPERGVPEGLRVDGTPIHEVVSIEEAHARYLAALQLATEEESFPLVIRDWIILRLEPGPS